VTITAQAADWFRVQPWQWLVERTFGWLGRYRQLQCEYHPEIGKAVIQVAMIDLTLCRLHSTQ
jgi:putative transposase